MKRVMSLFVVLLFVAGCTPGVEDLINELDGYEEYECYYGDARLPVGSHPEYLITPEGYVWECDDIGDVSFHSDGTFSATLNSRAYSETRDYFDDCNGFPSREQTGEWVVSLGRLCSKNDDLQPGIYACQRFTYYESGRVSLSGSVNIYDENGTNIGSEHDPDTCTLREE